MKIMIVGDKEALFNSLQVAFQYSGYNEVELFWYYHGRVALSQIDALNIDILIADISVDGFTNHEITKRATQNNPDLNVMIYSAQDDSSTVCAAIKAGANSYILAPTNADELATSLRQLHGGGSPMTPRVARMVIGNLQSDSVTDSLNILTNREKQVFQCMEQGRSYKSISAQLNITRNTVHTHIKNIYGKLDAENKLDALIKAKLLMPA